MFRVFRVKYLLPVFLFGIFLSFFFLVPISPAQAASGIIISEIQISGEKSADEFVELYNPSSEPVDISGYQLRRKTSSPTATPSSLKEFGSNSIIPPQGFYLWAASESIFASPFADTNTGDALANNNSLALYTKRGSEGILVDTLSWGTGAKFVPESPALPNPGKNQSFVRDPSSLNWSISETPTPTNSAGQIWGAEEETAEEEPPLIEEGYSVRINEVLPNPKGDDAENEFVELYNFGERDVDLTGWKLKDASGSSPALSGTLEKGEYVVLKRDNFKVALNNTDETLRLFDAADNLVHEMRYQTSKEDVSWNFSGTTWRGSKTLTPGSPNILNNAPVTKERVPKKAYQDVAAEFDARGRDTDNEKLKYTWDFGDGKKSYKEKATHKYRKKGKYTVTLKTSDASEDSTETFTIKVEDFPEYDLRIKALLPNPAGADEEAEWIVIENKEKKDINLKGYGIATGSSSDKVANHPIREDFILEKRSETVITREVALFTLPNKKGRVELRAPDGQVIDKAKYKLEKSVAEDTVYFKEKGQEWAWKPLGDDSPTEEIAALAGETGEAPAELITKTENESLPGEPFESSQPLEREEIPETPEEGIGEAQVLGVEDIIIAEKKPSDILAYGAKILWSLGFLYAVEKAQAAGLPVAGPPQSAEKKMPVEHTGQFFSDLNAWMNAWLNSP